MRVLSGPFLVKIQCQSGKVLYFYDFLFANKRCLENWTCSRFSHLVDQQN